MAEDRLEVTRGKKEKRPAAAPPGYRLAVSAESFVFIGLSTGLLWLVCRKMGLSNMVNTIMNTAYSLLQETVFYIMAIAVLAGAVSGLMTEFGVVALINRLLSGLMMPLYHLPGASVLGILSTYLSDNPAILTLAEDRGFRCFFKKYQLPALTNLGTSFGMGMIITTFMFGLQTEGRSGFLAATLLGNLGAVAGSIVSVRLMLCYTRKVYGTEALCEDGQVGGVDLKKYRPVRSGTAAGRFIEAMLEGGKSGVQMGVAIIPGVLIICTLVLILTNGPGAGGSYTGAAYEGIGLLPEIGKLLTPILKPLFGFSSPEAIAVPITALGAAGASIGLIPSMVNAGLAGARDIAVFTAMCMCWSGYLSTHVAMMDSLGCSNLTGKAIFSHTIGGMIAGITANILCMLCGL